MSSSNIGAHPQKEKEKAQAERIVLMRTDNILETTLPERFPRIARAKEMEDRARG